MDWDKKPKKIENKISSNGMKFKTHGKYISEKREALEKDEKNIAKRIALN